MAEEPFDHEKEAPPVPATEQRQFLIIQDQHTKVMLDVHGPAGYAALRAVVDAVTRPVGVLTFPGTMTDAEMEKARERWASQYATPSVAVMEEKKKWWQR